MIETEIKKSTFIGKLLTAASKYGGKTAIVDKDGERKSTYEELITLSRKVTAYIKSKGILKQSYICVMLPSSIS